MTTTLLAYGKYEIKEFEELYNEYYDLFTRIVNKNCAIAARFLMKFGIDTYDKNSILDIVTNSLDDLEERFKEYYSDLETVQLKACEFSADAEMRSKVKNPWRGGGVGFEGAILGAIQADVLNAGSNFIGKIEDGIINIFDRRTLNKLKNDCLATEKAIRKLYEILYCMVHKLGEVVYEIIVAEGKAIENEWLPLDSIIAKRNNLVELYNEGGIDEESLLSKLAACYKENPFQVHTKSDMYDIDSTLSFELTLLCELDGTERWAYTYFYDMEPEYTRLYYFLTKNKESNLPELDNGFDNAELVLENLLWAFAPEPDTDMYKENKIYDFREINVGLFRTGMEKMLKETFEKGVEQNEVTEIILNEQLYANTVVQLVLDNGLLISEAIDTVLTALASVYDDCKDSLDIWKELFIDYFKQIEDKLDKFSVSEYIESIKKLKE